MRNLITKYVFLSSFLSIVLGFSVLLAQPDLQKLYDYNTRLIKVNTADIDGDGDLDYMRSLDRHNNLTIHKLDFGATPQATLAANLGYFDDGDFIDINSDGIPDAAVTGRGYAIRLFMNNGAGGFSYAGDIPGDESVNSYSLRAVDIDNDGDEDIVTGTYEGYGLPGSLARVYLFTNDNGSFNFSEEIVLAYGIRVHDIEAADFDGDGDQDLFLANSHAQGNRVVANFYENDGNGHFTPRTQSEFHSFYYQVGVADLDDDGDPDLFGQAGGSVNNPVGSYMFINEGNFSFTPVLAVETTDNTQWATFADLDSDGDQDLVNSQYYTSTKVYLNDGSNNFSLYDTYTSNYDLGHITEDFDGNGSVDIFTSGYQGGLYSNYTIPSNKTEQTITILGGYGNAGDIDPYTDASLDNGQTWGPAYLTGGPHPFDNWFFGGVPIPGTNSWINYQTDWTSPSWVSDANPLYVDFRIRFNIPDDYENPSMDLQVRVDNFAEIKLNGQTVANISDYGSAVIPEAELTANLQAGLNEITLRLKDTGGIVAMAYRIDLTMYSSEDLSDALEPSESSQNEPPVANAGLDQTFGCLITDEAVVTLDGSLSSDPDGDELTYRWSLNNNVVSTSAAFDYTLGGGDHVFTLTVSDGKEEASDDVLVSVNLDETAPTISAPDNITVSANTAGGFAGSIGKPEVTDNCDPEPSVTNNAPEIFELGTTEVLWTATDAAGNSSIVKQVVTVEAFSIMVDIKPGNDNNVVNPKNKGVLPVAVLTDGNFDATKLDVSTLLFGNGEAKAAHKGHFEDVDDDGDLDLMLHFPTQDIGLEETETTITLVGKTLSGVPVSGFDNVFFVGNAGNGKGKDKFALIGNRPNPFNPTTVINYSIPDNQKVRLTIYNMIGQEVATLVNGNQSAGLHSVTFNASNLSTGTYFYILESGGERSIQQMTFLK